MAHGYEAWFDAFGHKAYRQNAYLGGHANQFIPVATPIRAGHLPGASKYGFL